jgi:Molybdopterin converting factor, large subunit
MRSENQVFASIQTAPIDVPSLLSSFGTDADGAISAFIGKIRNHDPETEDARVVAIQYSAHPEAETILERIVSEATMGAPDAANIHVLVIHRVGLVKVGEVALLTLVAAPHRRPGISLVGEIVERVKAELPVWKKQVLDDGSEKWSRLP